MLLSLGLALLSPLTQDPELRDGEAPPPKASTYGALHYRCVGPTRGGRVTTVAGVRQQRGTFYLGATGGGVFKTSDFGHSWQNVSDGFFATPSIGAIRVAPSDPDVVWVGTGTDGLRSNLIQGRGVYRSGDGGERWELMGLADTGQIGAVEIHPHNADVVFVAAIGDAFDRSAARGLFRTRDGGRSWEHVLFVSEQTGIVDVEFCPADPNVLYAAAWQAERKPWTIVSGGEEGGVYRSTDGGSTWQKLGGGLPDAPVGKIDLAVTAADPTRLYALVEAPDELGGVYRSADGGETFVQTSDERGLRTRPFYYTNIDADPNDADRLYVNSTGFYRSDDGGRTWQRRRTPHGDNHDIWIHPDDSDLMIQANDGGANVTLDGGRSWSTQHNQPTAELYQVAVDDRFPYWIYGGQQDNSTIRVPALPPWPAPAGGVGYWQSVGGCETGPAIPKPGDPDVVYASCKGRFGVFHFRTGQERQYQVGASNLYGHDPQDLRYRFQRVSPIHVSPHDPSVIYHASQLVHRTTNEGRSWTAISPDLTAFDPERQGISGAPITRDITGEEYYSCLYALRESPVEAGVIWVGANDGPIHVTRNGGESWTDVTPDGLPGGGRVQCVEPSPHRAGKAFVCVLRYQLGDDRPHVYRTDDFGGSWTRLSTPDCGVPANAPARVVREDPAREGLLYLGTEYGMFVSFDDGTSWQSLQLDLPVTPITDLVVHRGDLVLSTMGRSFWVLDDLSPLREWGGAVRTSELALCAPRPAHRLRYRASRGVPEFPSPGATIDYWVPTGFDGELTLEIASADGPVVRTFSSNAASETETPRAEPGMRGFSATERVGAARLSTTPGHNRMRWDMRLPGPWHERSSRSGRGGPLAPPGAYRLVLHSDSVERTALLELKMDPRVIAEGITKADIHEQVLLQRHVQDVLERTRRLAVDVRERLASSADDGERERLTTARDALVTADGAYPQPMLQDQLEYLARMLDRADQRPGQDAVARIAELETELDRIGAAVR